MQTEMSDYTCPSCAALPGEKRVRLRSTASKLFPDFVETQTGTA